MTAVCTLEFADANLLIALEGLSEGQAARMADLFGGVLTKGKGTPTAQISVVAGKADSLPHRRSVDDGELQIVSTTGETWCLSSHGAVRVTADPFQTRVFWSGVSFSDCIELIQLALTRSFAAAGMAVLHAAAFQYRDKGYLLLGSSGAGKSTWSSAVAAVGGKILSDDLLLVQGGPGSEEIRMFPMRADLLLREGGVPFWEEAVEVPDAAGGTRWQVRRRDHPLSFVDSLSPDFLITMEPFVGEAESRVSPVSAADGVAGLIRSMSSVYLAEPFQVERSLLIQQVQCLTATRPSLRLFPGRDVLDDPVRVMDRLEKVCVELDNLRVQGESGNE